MGILQGFSLSNIRACHLREAVIELGTPSDFEQ
jgi:hypothetical protein